MRKLAQTLDDASRRRFLAQTARLALGVGLSTPLLQGFEGRPIRRVPTAKKVIYLYMSGGMSHLDTFDLKPGADVQGPVQAIATSADGVRISEYLPRLATQMHHAAVVNSLTSTQGAHAPGQYFMHTSYAPRGTIQHPAMGAWVSHCQDRHNTTLPANVLIGGGSNHPGRGYLSAPHAPLPIGDPQKGLQNSKRSGAVDGDRHRRRMALSDQMNKRFMAKHDSAPVRAYHNLYDEALTLMQSSDLAAFDITQESRAMRAYYGESRIGQGCLLARRLIEHDVRFVEVNMGGWDTHTDNFERVGDNCQNLDMALSALIADLHSRGLLEETLIVLATEFGRKPVLNKNQGRDHHPACFSGLIAGGGIHGGQVFGNTDERAARVIENPVTVPDFNATIAYALGLPVDQKMHSPEGRPFKIADKGKPITALF